MQPTYQEWIDEFKKRTAKQASRHVSQNEYLTILYDGKDSEGNKVIDKFCDIHLNQLTVELPDGQWRIYYY